MKSKVYVSAYLVKGKKVNGMKRDVLVLASVDEGNVSQPRPCTQVLIDRTEEGKVKDIVVTALNNYIAALPYPALLAGLIHRTHCRGVPIREQYRAMAARRAPVMGPNPITEEVRFAIEQVAEDQNISCASALELKGPALAAAESFMGKVGFNYINAGEKRALMLALNIKTRSSKSKGYITRIATLEKRFDKAVARKQRAAAKTKLRIVA